MRRGESEPYMQKLTLSGTSSEVDVAVSGERAELRIWRSGEPENERSSESGRSGAQSLENRRTEGVQNLDIRRPSSESGERSLASLESERPGDQAPNPAINLLLIKSEQNLN